MFTADWTSDPHPTYDWMRAMAPVRQVATAAGTPVWLIARYDDARASLADPRLSKDVARFGTDRPPAAAIPGAVRRLLLSNMLEFDPPDHTRLRRLVAGEFTGRRVAAMEPRVHAITQSLLDNMAERDSGDLIADFAFPLPIAVICELLGVPAKDRDRIRLWSGSIIAGLAGEPSDFATHARLISDYLRDLVSAKRALPDDDLLTALVAARDGGDQLSEAELVAMAFLLLVAGHETTTGLIGTGVRYLLRNHAQRDLLAKNPALLPTAIEELLRLSSPLEFATWRVATEQLEIAGVTIPAGAAVLVALGSANRDKGRFSGAEQLDLARADNPHLAFGFGIHHCLGAPLARLEARIGIGALLTRFPLLRVRDGHDQPDWRPGFQVRSLTSLPVRWDNPR